MSFDALRNGLFARILANGSPEAIACEIVNHWAYTVSNRYLRDYLDWEANHGFDDRAARAMFSMSPNDIAELLGANAKGRKAVLDALEQRLENEALNDISWQDHLRDPWG